MTGARLPAPRGDAHGAILVALPALVLPGQGEPRPVPGAKEAIARLAMVGRPVILAGSELGSRRLAAEAADAGGWVATRFGLGPDVEIAALPTRDERPGNRRASEAARASWAAARAAHGAAWLVTDRPVDVRPAQAAGLRVVLVGARGGERSLAGARPDVEARDLDDAARLLLARDVFGAGPGL